MVLDHFKAIRAAHIDNIWNTYQRHIPDDSFMFNIFVNMSVFILILLSCYVFWEYVKFYKRRSRLLKPLKCIDIGMLMPNYKSMSKWLGLINFTDGDFVYNVEECPICLNGFMIPTRLACGHAYCLNCLVTYFSCNNLEWKCICPLCRSLVHSIKVLNVSKSNLNQPILKIFSRTTTEM